MNEWMNEWMNESFTQRYGAGRMIQSQVRSFWLPVFTGFKPSHKSHGIIFTEVNGHAYTCSLYQCTWMKLITMSIFIQLKSYWTCKSQTCTLICVITYTNQYGVGRIIFEDKKFRGFCGQSLNRESKYPRN